jgi:dipeptidyl aminopeptidase/acylaminoacyl peptidase
MHSAHRPRSARRRLGRQQAHHRASRTWLALALLGATLLAALAAAGDSASEWRDSLPEPIVRLLEADPMPDAALDPTGRYLLEVHKHGLLSSRALSQPMLSVAGVPINPLTLSRHAPLPYFAFTLTDVATGLGASVPLPRHGTIGFPAWSPDGARYAFTVTTDEGVELWIGTAQRRVPRRLIGPVLNAALSTPCTWMPDARHVLCRVAAEIDARREVPPEVFSEPAQTGGRFSPRRDHEAETRLVERYLTSRLELIDVVAGVRRTIGAPGVLESADPSPDGRYLLVARTVPPYFRRLASDPTPRAVEIWSREGELVRELVVERRDGGMEPPRAPHWHASRPSTLVWVETHVGGDRVAASVAPFEAPAREIFRTQANRFSGLTWLAASDRGVLSEYDALARVTRMWLIDPDAAEEPVLLGSRGVDVAAPDFGRPLTTQSSAGKPVVRVHANRIFLRGQEHTPEGTIAYLETLDLKTLTRRRHWQSSAGGYERAIDIVDPAGDAVLTQHQSAREPPNYRVRAVADDSWRALTHHTHPAPQLQDATRYTLFYQRADGLDLSSTMYVPPNRESGERLPLIVWAYPKDYGPESPPAAQPVPERFLDVDRGLKLFFLLRGYAVMDDVAMPVVGEAGEANDTFVEQVVDNARAAISAAVETGIADPHRVGVAGHSYGAFMVANLLAHSELFRAGAALSGAYNRTLTPFGFQTERRTLWEARDTYLRMSPFFFSDQIEAPLLLVHGLRDDNAGTSPMQSQYFYEAIRRHGGEADLLLLPLEGHAYRGRESVLRTASAMLRWFDAHVKGSDTLDAASYLATDHTAEPAGAGR